MFDHKIPVKQLKQQLRAEEGIVARARSRQVEILGQLELAQIAMQDGYSTTEAWTAGWLDTAPEAASALVRLSRTMSEDSETARSLSRGEVSFDRAVAETDLKMTGASPRHLKASRERDISGVRRLTARNKLHDRTDEAEAFEKRHFVLQPNLDESSWRFSGVLAGVDGRIVEKALHQRGDEFPDLPDGSRPTIAQRNADALTSICQDSLTGISEDGADRSETQITVFVDASAAADRFGMAGVEVEGGPSIGAGALSELLCNGRIDFTAIQDGTPLGIGTNRAVVPPKLRRYVLWRDGGCVIDGCQSRYRLQTHHVFPASRYGPTEADNLVTLCWYHHHVAIHGHGMHLEQDAPAQRQRLTRETRGP